MQAIALALFPPFAVGTSASLERRMITEQAETAFPHVHEIVHVDTALAIRCADSGASGDSPVHTHGSDAQAGLYSR